MCRESELLDDRSGQGIGRVDWLEILELGAFEVVQQEQAADPEESVEDVGHVAGSVRDAAVVLVLALHDELPQLIAIDPRRLRPTIRQ